MNRNVLIPLAVRLVRAGTQAYARKWSFLALSVFVFFGNVVVLAALDLLPDLPKSAPVAPLVVASTVTPAPVVVSELPVKIEIPSINVSATIANPTTTVVEVLDQDLLRGAVRYPTSAALGEGGNVVLFGHSSYLPIVRNQAYKTFNGIQKLVPGDTVIVYSSHTAYTYRVRSLMKESTKDAGIPLSVPGKVLTLATCDSFGAKTDRFVVVADFVESHSLST